MHYTSASSNFVIRKSIAPSTDQIKFIFFAVPILIGVVDEVACCEWGLSFLVPLLNLKMMPRTFNSDACLYFTVVNEKCKVTKKWNIENDFSWVENLDMDYAAQQTSCYKKYVFTWINGMK